MKPWVRMEGHIQPWSFRMESLETLPWVVSEGDWFVHV